MTSLQLLQREQLVGTPLTQAVTTVQYDGLMKYVGAILAMVLVFVVHITVIGMVVRVHATAVSVTAAAATASDTTPVATFPEIHGMTDLIYFHLSKGMNLCSDLHQGITVVVSRWDPDDMRTSPSCSFSPSCGNVR